MERFDVVVLGTGAAGLCAALAAADTGARVGLFEKGEFADRVPEAVEPPFALVLAGQVVRGRIDAVYREQVDGRPGYLLVDWKTNRHETADPLQLAIYRVAWSELTGTPLSRVRAAFYDVRSGTLVERAGLDDRDGLERLMQGRPGRPG